MPGGEPSNLVSYLLQTAAVLLALTTIWATLRRLGRGAARMFAKAVESALRPDLEGIRSEVRRLASIVEAGGGTLSD